MKYDETTVWNRKYREGSHTSLSPDPFLLASYSEFLADTQPGVALDVAGGIGRHSLWLAERGWRVKLVDISGVGVNLAQENFHRRRYLHVVGSNRPAIEVLEEPTFSLAVEHPALFTEQLETEVLDLSRIHDLGHEQYDLILVFFYLQRSLFPALFSALRPGGFLIYKTYTTDSRRLGRGPTHPLHLLQPNELLRAFQSLRILHYHETTKERGIAELVAQKMTITGC